MNLQADSDDRFSCSKVALHSASMVLHLHINGNIGHKQFTRKCKTVRNVSSTVSGTRQFSHLVPQSKWHYWNKASSGSLLSITCRDLVVAVPSAMALSLASASSQVLLPSITCLARAEAVLRSTVLAASLLA